MGKTAISFVALLRSFKMESTRDSHRASVLDEGGGVVADTMGTASIEFAADLARGVECLVMDIIRSTISSGCNPIHLTPPDESRSAAISLMSGIGYGAALSSCSQVDKRLSMTPT